MKLRQARPCKKNNFSGSKKMFFFRAALLKLRQARLCKKNFSGSKKLFFPRCSYEAQTSPALQKTTTFRALKNCFSRAALMKLRQARLCKKTTTFQALKKYFFRNALMKLRQARPCKKKNQALKHCFFRMSLVKSANSTSLPRFSSLQNAQMHTIHNEECSENLRDPRPIVVEICLHSKIRIWGTLGLKLSDF